MAKEVSGVEAPKTTQQTSRPGQRSPFVFEPMRRKMHIAEPKSDQ